MAQSERSVHDIGMRLFLVLITGILTLAGQENTLAVPAETPKLDLRLWKASAATLAATSALDVFSSWGKCCERNRLLASSDGRFGGRAVAIKSGALGGQLLLQYFVVRRSPKLAKVLGFVNFAGAGAVTAVAIHNFRSPQPAASSIRSVP
jgi:hypothetical protein